MFLVILTCLATLHCASASPFPTLGIYPYDFPNSTNATNTSPTNPDASPIPLPPINPTTTNDDPITSSSSSNAVLSNPETIAGISFAGALFAALIVGLILWVCQRRRSRFKRYAAEAARDGVWLSRRSGGNDGKVTKTQYSLNRVLDEKETEAWWRERGTGTRPRSALPAQLWRNRVGGWPY
jgi:hypothetical protein